jgi:hypothetical protein
MGTHCAAYEVVLPPSMAGEIAALERLAATH